MRCLCAVVPRAHPRSIRGVSSAAAPSDAFVFTPDNFVDPKLPAGLNVIDAPLTLATAESLKGYGRLVNSPDEFTVEKNNFEILPWPVSGWRELDPGTGDEGVSSPSPQHAAS
jgi:hypothetical protein